MSGQRTKLYKLTDADGYTRRGYGNETKCEEGHVVTATCGRQDLCTDGFVHAYRHPELGLALNPIHADISKPRLWLCEGIVRADDGLKVGCRRLHCLEELEVTAIPVEALIRWSIYLVMLVQQEGAIPIWDRWARGWLDGSDRSARAAWAARAAWEARAAWAASVGFDPKAWADLAQCLLLQAIREEEEMRE